MTVRELNVLKQDGTEVALSFTDTGVLCKKEENGKITDYLRRNPDAYIPMIDQVMKDQDLSNAVAISGKFVDENGNVTEQEGLLGEIFYSV